MFFLALPDFLSFVVIFGLGAVHIDAFRPGDVASAK